MALSISLLIAASQVLRVVATKRLGDMSLQLPGNNRSNKAEGIGSVDDPLLLQGNAGRGSGSSRHLVEAFGVELHTWWSPSRHDYFSTTQPVWHGGPGQTRSPDYQWVRLEGRLISPFLSEALASPYLPMYLLWNPTTQDNALVPSDEKSALLAVGYSEIRMEGYSFLDPTANTLELFRFRGPPPTEDHAIIAGPESGFFLEGGITDFYVSLGQSGYIFDPSYNINADLELARYFGYEKGRITGTRPLLVIVRDHPNTTTTHDTVFYESLLFDNTDLSIPGYFSANSHNAFTFSRLNVIEVPGSDTDVGWLSDTEAIRLAGDIIDFDSLDLDDNKVVTSGELALVGVNKDGVWGAQTRGVACTQPNNNEVLVCPDMSFVGEMENFMVFAHEIAHQIQLWDLYGPGWNTDATLGAVYVGGHNPGWSWNAEAWHRMFWGWVEPRMVNLLETSAIVKRLLLSNAFGSAVTEDKKPILLYDPNRGRNEFFLMELRANDGAYDADVVDDGLAVWLINLDSNGYPKDILFQNDADPELEHIFGIRVFQGPDATGIPGLRGGHPRFIRHGDGPVPLSWSDGTPVKTSPSDAGTLHLQFEFAYQDSAAEPLEFDLNQGFVRIATYEPTPSPTWGPYTEAPTRGPGQAPAPTSMPSTCQDDVNACTFALFWPGYWVNIFCIQICAPSLLTGILLLFGGQCGVCS